MEFKCQVLYFGKSNKGKTLTVNGRGLRFVVDQRDLGIQVHCFLKVVSQVNRVAKKIVGTLAPYSQRIDYRNWEVRFQSYKMLMKPHWDYIVFSLGHPTITRVSFNWREFKEDLPGYHQTRGWESSGLFLGMHEAKK